MVYWLGDLDGPQNGHGRDAEEYKLYPYNELNTGRLFAQLLTSFYCLFYLNESHESREISNHNPALAQLNSCFSFLPSFLVLNSNEYGH
jgi:hypothetical protein